MSIQPHAEDPSTPLPGAGGLPDKEYDESNNQANNFSPAHDALSNEATWQNGTPEDIEGAELQTLAERLISARLAYGEKLYGVGRGKEFTQGDLAKLVGITQAIVSRLEAGQNKGSSEIVRIALALEVRPEWLDQGIEPRYPDSATAHILVARRELIANGMPADEVDAVIQREYEAMKQRMAALVSVAKRVKR
ncbi:MAG: helix-turn-helix transcriptional regulator [Burkholderiales bacterium]|nr:helix-turn-helix transcriptional regulator [Burkholderiales bacterium]